MKKLLWLIVAVLLPLSWVFLEFIRSGHHLLATHLASDEAFRYDLTFGYLAPAPSLLLRSQQRRRTLWQTLLLER